MAAAELYEEKPGFDACLEMAEGFVGMAVLCDVEGFGGEFCKKEVLKIYDIA